MKTYCFTIDDNIRFLKEITERKCEGLFSHPYTAMLRRLHEKFNLKIQLNLFYRTDGFDLSQMSDKYREQWRSASDWLKLSFHSDFENVCPYESSDYDEVFKDCAAVNKEILRFASQDSLAKTTTVHYCQTTPDGVRALSDNGISGLLGLFGTRERPHTSYSLDDAAAKRIREGETVYSNGMSFAAINTVINNLKMSDISPTMSNLLSRDALRVMIHEQYFYEDHRSYQPDFEDKLAAVFTILADNGYESRFFEDMI